MQIVSLFLIVLFLAPTLGMAQAAPAPEGGGKELAPHQTLVRLVADAISKLKGTSNYSWITTEDNVNGYGAFEVLRGQADQNGFSEMRLANGRDFIEQILMKADRVAYKVAAKTEIKGLMRVKESLGHGRTMTSYDQVVEKVKGGWYLVGGEGTWDTFAGIYARNGPPTQEAEIALKHVEQLKAMEGGSIGGEFTADGAMDMMTLGSRRAPRDNDFPVPKNARGAVTFWIRDGLLVKYEMRLHGEYTINPDDKGAEVIRTVEITQVGTTQLKIPAEAKKKLDER